MEPSSARAPTEQNGKKSGPEMVGSLKAPFPLPDGAGLIVIRDEYPGAILRVSNGYSIALRDRLPLEAGAAGNTALSAFLSELPAEIGSLAPVEEIEAELKSAAKDRSDAVKAIERAQASLDTLGPARQKGEKDAFQTLAQNIPPGILLLFLLATLSSLYRYNIRLAGFHHARADALTLAASDQHVNTQTLSALVDSLAADKVEFARTNTPADQATEIAKTVISRVRPSG